MPQDPSDLTFGPYRVVRRIGRGCMGVVYLARDAARNREVALKVMLPDIVSDENARARFSREARAAAGLQHRNIVTVIEFSEDAEAPYIAMEFLRGRSLADALNGGPVLSRDAKLDVAIQLCEGLQFAHEQGVVHRDVKPANIWLLDDGGVKLLDFGIARLAGSTVTQIGNVVGSAAYMAPEQLAGKPVDGRADIFSAGVVLYELLAGRRPFEADTVTGVMVKILHEEPPPLQGIVEGITEDVTAAIDTALKKDPDERYPQAADFGADLRLARHLSAHVPAARSTEAVTGSWPPGPSVVDRIGTGERTPVRPGGAAERSGSGERSAVAARAGSAERAPASTGAGQAGTGGSSDRTGTDERRAGVMASSTDETSLSFDLHLRPAGDVRGTADVPVAQPASSLLGRPLALGAIAAVVALIAIAAFAFRSGTSDFEIDVQSSPVGAAIAINGVDTGQRTPAIFSVKTAPERVGLTLDGFVPIDAPVTGASAAAPIRLRYALKRLLRIRSEPAGARILFDGSEIGKTTPADMPMPDPAPRTIELQLAGHVSRREAIAAAALDRGEIQLTLKPTGAATTAGPDPGVTAAGGVATGAATRGGARGTTTVRLFGTYPFAVSGCGKESPAATEHTLQVAAPCRLQLVAREYFLNLTRPVESGGARSFDIAAPEIVRVSLRSGNENCRVIFDGEDLGPPVALTRNVAAGGHEASLKCPDNRLLELRRFQIVPGQQRVVLDDYIIR